MNARNGWIALLLGLMLAPAAYGFDRQSALGAKGELFVAYVGNYADLFPGGHATDGTNTVLALDVIDPAHGTTRLLVPGTENADVEQLPFLLYEESSATLFMVWQAQVSLIHPILNLGSFHDGQWGDVIPVLGDPFAKKSSPQLGVTRESYVVKADDDTSTTVNRTVLHLVWAEDNATGTQDAFYTPIILDDGKYLGSNPIYRLNDYDASPAARASGDVAKSLLVAPRLETGPNDQTVVVTFANAATKRLVSIVVGALPRQLSALADGARAQIIDVGVKLYPQNLQQLADAASAAILASGTSFYPEFVHTMADTVHALILNAPKPSPHGLKDLADAARAQIIDVGVKLGRGGLVNQTSASTALKTTIEEVQSQSGDSAPASETHLFQFQVAASRTAPRVGDGAVLLFSSENGQKALASWQQSSQVQYLEATPAGWSDVRTIPLSDQLGLDKVQQLLEHRVRQ
jgi:hypothetical protein